MGERIDDIFRPEVLKPVHTRMHEAAQHLRLPFRSQVWQGRTGSWFGAGAGSSIDFQDHRPYYPGDDPRHIDWQAYARTEHYIMKLYREEVNPRVDVVLDVSQSMFFEDTKRTRTLELLYFVLESARQCGASIHSVLIDGNTRHELPAEWLLTYRLPASVGVATSNDPPDISTVAWRYGSLRVVISDLLFPTQPEPWLAALGIRKGRGLLLAPFCLAEMDPEWSGNITFIDCETTAQRKQQVDPEFLEHYKSSYARHFAMWHEACVKYGFLFARIPSQGGFYEALQSDAVGIGAVELCK